MPDYTLSLQKTCNEVSGFGEKPVIKLTITPLNLQFSMTINTALGSGTPDFTLPLRSGFNYNMTVDWGDSSTSEITAYNDPDITHNYASGGTYQITMEGTCQSLYFNNSGDRLKLVSIDSVGTLGFIALDRAFYGCSNLTTITVDNVDWCENVTNMNFIFNSCSSLTEIPDMNMSNVTNLLQAFQNCSSMTSFGVSDLSSCTNFNFAWNNCTSLTSLPSDLNTSNGLTFESAWYNCTDLTSFPSIDTSKATSVVQAWRGCSSLTSFPSIVVTGCTSLSTCWTNCSSLTSFPSIDTGTITNFSVAWTNCSSIVTFPELDTVNATTFLNTWAGCFALTGVTDMGNWIVTGVTNMSNMFSFVTLATSNYDSILIGWAAQNVKSGVTANFGSSKYTTGGAAEAARSSLIADDSWSITDGGGV